MSRLSGIAAALALLAGVGGPTAASAGAAAEAVPASWRTVQLQGVSVAVPGDWPVYDLEHAPRCARRDRHAVYLGHQPAAAACPSRLIGRSEAVHLEPLDASVATEASFATQAAVVNGQRVRLDPAAGVTHAVVVAVDRARVLLTISYRADRRLADQVLDTLTVASGSDRADAPAPAAAPAAGAAGAADTLASGAVLAPGRSLRTDTSQHVLVMQTDGNLVLYSEGMAAWSSGTWGHPGAEAVMQTDGNLVVYATTGAPLWASGTAGRPVSDLALQGDGNVVLYTGPGAALWATDTIDSALLPGQSLVAGWYLVAPVEELTLQMQADGNVVLYDAGEPLWSTGTWGHPGATAVMQADGNLVVYGGSGALWSSGTFGSPGGSLALQADGNLVVSAAGRPLWSTGTTAHVFGGLGFDTCAAPSVATMGAWLASPYRAVGIYLGGANRACPDGNLSASWVTRVAGMGWSLVPIYVGLQAPCTSGFATIDPGSAGLQGAQAADDAVSRARAFGIPSGSPIFFDMEAYSPTGGSCTSTVTTFLTGWAREVRANGYRAGDYSSLDSGILDLVATPGAQPDEIWFAEWDGDATTSDPLIPTGDWPAGHRVKQFQGGHTETYDGVSIGIDRDDLDALLR